MEMQSLAELKAENEAEDAILEGVSETSEETAEEATNDTETEDNLEDSEPEEGKTEEVESWMEGDEPESQADKKFTDGDIGAAKAKLRAKLERKHDSETETLKAEIERLKQGKVSTVLTRPKREAFDNSDDPDMAFSEALMDWKLEQNAAKTATKTTQAEATQRQQQYQESVSQATDQHYERAVKLAKDSGISSEAYQASDRAVRQAIDSVYPSGGDAITDDLISKLGEGSEKVFYSLGVNSTKRAKLVQLLNEDRTGGKACMYLGRLSSELSAPSKRKTNAPKPAAQLKGDAQSSSKSDASRKKYDKLMDKGDVQKAFTMRRAAKKSGTNTNSW